MQQNPSDPGGPSASALGVITGHIGWKDLIYIYNYINTVYDRCIYATLIQCKDNMPSSVGMYQDQLSTRCAVQDLQIVVSLHFLGQFLHYIKLVPQAGDLFFQHPSTITGA